MCPYPLPFILLENKSFWSSGKTEGDKQLDLLGIQL